MQYDVHVTETSPQLVVATRRHTRRSTISDDIASGFGALLAAMGRSGTQAVGAPFVIYHTVIDQESVGDIEICIPVATSIESVDDVYSYEMPSSIVAATTHRGSYQQLAAAFQAVTEWIGASGHLVAGAPREIYLNDPHTVAPEDLLTRVEWPVAPKN